MEDVTPLSDAYILDIIIAHLSTAGIHQTIMFLGVRFLVALADMGETRRCGINKIYRSRVALFCCGGWGTKVLGKYVLVLKCTHR